MSLKLMCRLLFPCLLTAFLSCQTPVSTVISKGQIILNLNKLKPQIDLGLIVNNPHACAIDRNGDLYFVIGQSHCIYKFNQSGQMIGRLGSIGQGSEGLFYPGNVFQNNTDLCILDDGGRNLKVMSPDGKIRSYFEIPNAFCTDAFCSIGSEFYLNPRYKIADGYNNQSLISVFSKDGKVLRKFGSIIQSNKFVGYAHFNQCHLQNVNGKVYGCFRFQPIVFAYDKDGKTLFYKNFGNSNINEIVKLEEGGRKKGCDTPRMVKNEKGTMMTNYFRAFAVDPDEKIFIVVNTHNPARSIFLCLDKNGLLINRNSLFVNNIPVAVVHQLIITGKGDEYCIGHLENNQDEYLIRITK